jgi:hypothetical protein
MKNGELSIKCSTWLMERILGQGSVDFAPFTSEDVYTMLLNQNAQVMRDDERRAETRYGTDVPVIVQIFGSSVYHRARKLNYSKSGVLLEGNVYLKPGATVCIRRERCPQNCPKAKACESCKTTALATVKWCHQNTPSQMTYSLGVKHWEYGIGC